MRKDLQLGDLINGIYESFMAKFGDSELALIATEVTLSEMINAGARADQEEDLAA